MLNRRRSLEVALTKAEANLHLAVSGLANAGANNSIESDNLDKARASCRVAHRALTKFDQAAG